MATTTELMVRLVADAKGFGAELGNASRDVAELERRTVLLGQSMKAVGSRMTVAFSLPIVAGFAAAVVAASNLEEAVNKADVTFGSSADSIRRWAAGAAQDFGLSERAALQASATFGTMFRQLGQGADSAAQMSRKMVELAADFASFHNVDVTQVLEAQAAAFRGEYDALQRFVPMINAAAVETKALAMTGKDNAASLTAQEKALATYQLMLEGAGPALGDFDRTQDSAANRMRQATAEIENAAAAFGSVLLPVVAQVAGALADFAGFLAGLPPGVKEVAVGFLALVAAAGPVLWVMGSLMQSVQVLLPALASVGPAFASAAAAAGPFVAVAGLVVGAVVGLKQAFSGGMDIDVSVAAMRRLTDAQIASVSSALLAHVGYDEFKSALRGVAEESSTTAMRMAESVDVSRSKREELIGVVEKEVAAQQRSAAAAQADAAAINAVGNTAATTALDVAGLHNSLNDLVGAQLGVEGAAIGMERAIANANAAIEAGTQDTLAGRQAMLDAKESAVRYGEAVFQAAVQAGASQKDAAVQQIAALQSVAAQLDPGSPLRTWIDGYIAQLEAIPKRIDTYIYTYRNVEYRVGASGGYEGYNPEGVVGFASGGVVPGPVGAAVPTVVHGGEVVLNPQQAVQVLWALGNGQGTRATEASGNTYNVSMTLPNVRSERDADALFGVLRRLAEVG